MPHDRFSQASNAEDAPRPRPAVSRGLLLAGVAAAGVMGVGLGLWARPAMSERRMVITSPAFQAQAQKPRGQIQIVLDETPAPVGEPIEVLPGRAGEPLRAVDLEIEPEPAAPVRPPEGLMRVEAPAPAARPAVVKAVAPSAPKARAAAVAPKPKAAQVASARPASPKAAPGKDHDVKLAKAKPARTAADLRLAKAKVKVRPAVELAQATKAQAAKAKGKVAQVLVRAAPRKARAEEPRLEKVKYARPKTPPRKAARAAVAKAPAKVAKVVTTRAAKPAARHETPAPPMRASGLMKVSNRSRCGQPDPGAALVCADPSLGAADRQLSRAYRDAQAAGVSDERLQRQQQRWLAARSAAAKEAPWAVHDVYLARIAELNGLAREAHNGN